MASQTGSSLTTTPSLTPSVSEDAARLSSQLDALLISYLDLLDVYTELRATLSDQLSSGFISLARAQRSCILGPGRRFGEECYDERMKARRLVRIQVEADAQEEWENADNDDADDEKPRKQRPDSNVKDRKESRTTTHSEHVPNRAEETGHSQSNSDSSTTGKTRITFQISHHQPPPASESSSNPTSSTPTKKNSDPIEMFTALPPPALRTAQGHFTACLVAKATEEGPGTIPQLLTVRCGIENLERRIRVKRRELKRVTSVEEGLQVTSDSLVVNTSASTDDDDHHRNRSADVELVSLENPTEEMSKFEGDVDVPHVSSLHINKEKRPSASSSSGLAPKQRKSLVSRSAAPTEPRSRILKIDG